MRWLIFLLLVGCSSPSKDVKFERIELLPSPVPGIIIEPDRNPRVIRTKIRYKTENCLIDYTTKESELQSNIECLLKRQ